MLPPSSGFQHWLDLLQQEGTDDLDCARRLLHQLGVGDDEDNLLKVISLLTAIRLDQLRREFDEEAKLT